jgi:hypothetical protein
MLGFYRAFAKLRAYLLRSVGSVAREKTCWRWWQIPSRFARTERARDKGRERESPRLVHLPLETRRGKERAFGLLRKVYAKRAAIRGRLQAPTVPTWAQQLLLFDFPMFFQKLVEQHRVHRFVAHGVDPSVLIAHHQVGVYLGYFLSD